MPFPYFSQFPNFNYDGTILTDITRRVRLVSFMRSQAVGFEKYAVRDKETIEAVSFKFYGDSGYHWLIMLANEILDPYYGWPLSDSELKDFVTMKYGIGQENAIHHYEPSSLSDLPAGTILDESTSEDQRIVITNYEYETDLNEQKRHIRILRKEFVPLIVEELKRKIVT